MTVLRFGLDAITDLPPGVVAALTTYLERDVGASVAMPAPAGFSLERLGGQEAERYRAIFRTLGERWLWWSRLAEPLDATERLLGDPRNEAYAVCRDGADAGLLEIDCRDAERAELKFLGLYEAAIGRGAGGWLVNEAVARAAAHGFARLFVHTCTFDAPGALGFYQRMGFKPYKLAIEVARDPRLTGVLPTSAGLHVPLIAPGREPRGP